MLFREARTVSPSEPFDNKAMDEELEKQKMLRLQLAKKNRIIACLQRQLDDVPNRAELAQYQRRFLELYNQGSNVLDQLINFAIICVCSYSCNETQRDKAVLYFV